MVHNTLLGSNYGNTHYARAHKTIRNGNVAEKETRLWWAQSNAKTDLYNTNILNWFLLAH